MKSILFLFATILLTITANAQNIKVKKGHITVDGKAVAKIEQKEKVCTISDLNGKPLFTAMITNQTPLNNLSSKKWLQLVGNNGNVKEIALDKVGEFTFIYKKHVAECLVLNSPDLFLDVISEPVVNSFFQTEDRSISTAEDLAINSVLEVNNREDSIAKSNQLTLESNGVITANNKNVGYIVSSSKLGENNQVYNVLDINKKQIATLTFNRFDASIDKAGSNNAIKTYDNNNFPLQEKYTSKKIQSDKLADRMVKKLFANGYIGDAKDMAIDKN